MNITELSSLEIRFLKVLKAHNTSKGFLSELTDISYVEAMRAAEFLQNKGVGVLGNDEVNQLRLTQRGIDAKENGLPEKRIVEFLKGKDAVAIDDLPFDKSEVKVTLGLLKRMKAIEFVKNGRLSIKLIHEPNFPEEKFLNLFNGETLDLSKIPNSDSEIVKKLKKRSLVKEEKKRNWWFKLTDKSALDLDLSSEIIDVIDEKVINDELWKRMKFRKYDLVSKVPRIYGGRRHFVSEVISKIRKIWLEMGFSEMQGSDIMSSFWDLDALFVPQDHPARSMQDSFFIKDHKKNVVAKTNVDDKEIVKRIKSVHENGWKTGSTGWQQKWDIVKAQELMLRTHTTALSVQTLYRLMKENKREGKFFTIDKAFRNETLDWKHLFEFNQVEGIVVGDVNFKNLLYYLKIFYKKLGFDKVKIIPSYFPYTEPSAEVHVWNKDKGEWMELGGSGIFRPEVVEPFLGKNVRVLAWGLGLERIVIMKYGIKDIRQIYGNDVEFLKSREVV